MTTNRDLKIVQKESDHIYTWVMDSIDELFSAHEEQAKARRTHPTLRQ